MAETLNFSQADYSAIAAATAKYNLPSWVLPGVAYKETRGETNPDTAVSSTGAIGLMQILPSTAAIPGYGVNSVARASLTDPNVSADFAGAYLQGLYNNTGSWDTAIARYSGNSYTAADVKAGAAVMPSGSSSAIASGTTPAGQDLTTNSTAGASGTSGTSGTSGQTGATTAAAAKSPSWLLGVMGSVGAFVNEALIVSLGIGLVMIALIFLMMNSKTVQVSAAHLATAA